jgi:hypothetical protein
MTRLAAILTMSLAAACAPTVGEDFSDEGGGGSGGGGGGGGGTRLAHAANIAAVSNTTAINPVTRRTFIVKTSSYSQASKPPGA